MEVIMVLLFWFYLLSTLQLLGAVDTIVANQTIKDGESIVSATEIFELGFFSPGSSQGRYLGIWYKKVGRGTVVWVANRNAPLHDSSGVLTVTNQGILALLNLTNSIIWSSISSTSPHNPVAQLLDTGNLVLKDGNDNLLWQSFDYPSDTLLPGMKFGIDRATGLDRYLSSWKSADDPAPGDFTFICDPRGYPQFIIKNGSVNKSRLGSWNGIGFSGSPNLRPNTIYRFSFVFSQKEVYYMYELTNSSIFSRFVLNQNGVGQRWAWVDRTQGWVIYLNAPTDNCDIYGLCGKYGSCNIANSPFCGCLENFVPKYPRDWNMADWSNGCVRETPLDCQNGDGFFKYSRIKLPDTQNSWINKTMSIKECSMTCLKNCSCMAYTYLDIRRGGSGCLLWFGDLIDMREFPEGGQDIYIRVASSVLGGSKGKKKEKIIIGLILSIGMLLLGLSLILHTRQKKKNKRQQKEDNPEQQETKEPDKEDVDLPLFDLDAIVTATDNFSMNNKLGEDGFGPVYKGILEDGKEIAVKRLSKDSRQGRNEFKNEVVCIAKLQHRNLVKLVGCCICEEEKMLIYEYMPNRGLDSFIFDETRSKFLDWPTRFHIINGIARGLLYLHQDSRLRIIHRDLKAGNILLDKDLNPKISDFGMARIFGGDETVANTSRVVGTYGYMSPEYQLDGLFSVKSDVFSFGVLVLEIVIGRRNRGFFHSDHHHNLLGHAWKLYKAGRSEELIDAQLGHLSEVLRSVHISLLCVQQDPKDRPSMSYVVMMLGSEVVLPQPKQPGFFTERNNSVGEFSWSQNAPTSFNEVTITLLEAR